MPDTHATYLISVFLIVIALLNFKFRDYMKHPVSIKSVNSFQSSIIIIFLFALP